MDRKKVRTGLKVFSASVVLEREIQKPNGRPKNSDFCFVIAPTPKDVEKLLAKKYRRLGTRALCMKVKLAEDQNPRRYQFGAFSQVA